MATNPSNVYCQLGDIADLISLNSVKLMTDDGPPTNLANAIAKAGDEVDWHCFKSYDPTQLAQSSLVTHWAAACAAFYLRTRRGNPAAPGAQIHYATAIKRMEEIQKGRNEIPGIAKRKMFVPTISIKAVSQVMGMNRGVIEVSRGSSVTIAENIQQEKDVWDALGFNRFLNNIVG